MDLLGEDPQVSVFFFFGFRGFKGFRVSFVIFWGGFKRVSFVFLGVSKGLWVRGLGFMGSGLRVDRFHGLRG